MFTLQTLDKVFNISESANNKLIDCILGMIYKPFQKVFGRLLDLCVKFFQEFVTWKISQDERFAARSKPEPVESALL